VTKDNKQKPDAAAADAAKQGQAAAPAEGAAPKKKGLMPMLMLGGGGLLLLAIVVAGTLYVIKPKATADGTGDQAAVTDSTKTKSEAGAEKKAGAEKAEATASKDSLTKSEGELKVSDPTATPELTAKEIDSADFMPAAVDTAEAMAALSKSIQVMDEANKSAQQEAAKSIEEDSAQEPAWMKKARESLAQKESALNARESALNKKDQQISAKLLKLEQASNDRVVNLAKLYDGMEAAAVAKLMANLDDSIVVALIPRMKQKNASDVLSMIPPVRAAAISKQIITIADEK
jgi:flagellar motility protein MotE (MotC chaperone)